MISPLFYVYKDDESFNESETGITCIEGSVISVEVFLLYNQRRLLNYAVIC